MPRKIELIDLVDKDGIIQKTSIPKNDLDLYPDLYMQIAIVVIFDRSGKILVQRRALTKNTEPGKIDQVCGVIKSGETPEQTAIRESLEEVGIKPENLEIIDKRLNEYKRFRYLLIGKSHKKPKVGDPLEVEWVKFVSLPELRQKKLSGEFEFVDGFFEDVETTLKAAKK